MKTEYKNGYTLVTSNEDTFIDFFTNFTKNHENLKEKHLIIKILDNFKSTKENILLFLKYAEYHQLNGTSFVVVCKHITIDDFPEIFNITPTIVEAEDIIEMENIQRDLGF